MSSSLFRRAALAAVALSLALAGVASAATTSSTTSATVTVDSVIAMSGVPATYDFGHGIAGTTLTGSTFSIVVNSSGAFTVAAATTDFTSGANTIPAGNLAYNGNLSAPAGVPVTIGTTTPLPVTMSLGVSDGQAPGVYTGTITFTASN